MGDCLYCAEVRRLTDPTCATWGPSGVCIRKPGHDGPHVACCSTDHQIDTWEDTP